MGPGAEKPLRRLGNKPLIEYVLEAALNAKTISEVICITSQNTPNTTKHLQSRGFSVVVGRGDGYYGDLLTALWEMPNDLYVVCSADIPFISSSDIDGLVKEYDERLNAYPYVFVAVPADLSRKLGLTASSRFNIDERETCPAGIRLIDTRQILDRRLPAPYILVVNEPRLAVNINTPEDLKAAEALLKTLPLKRVLS
jgi:GTP:adenosylcobinamide-phosphate guanylyltransferase